MCDQSIHTHISYYGFNHFSPVEIFHFELIPFQHTFRSKSEINFKPNNVIYYLHYADNETNLRKSNTFK